MTPEEIQALERARDAFNVWWEAQDIETEEPRDIAVQAFLAGIASVEKPN